MPTNEDPHGLPDYEEPPITELVLGVQFEPLPKLLAPQIGLFWADMRKEFPEVQQQPALEPVVERFGVKQAQVAGAFKLMETPETPRCWLLGENGSQLIQVQQDRFIRNWRKQTDADAYPRYENIRSAFAAEWKQFAAFVTREKLGDLNVNQAEVTYINNIRPSGVWETFGQADRVFGLMQPPTDSASLPPPEDVRFSVRYVLSAGEKPAGRLHVNVSPAYLRKDGSEVFVMNLTARGAPEGEGFEGALKFLDRAHRAIVLAFDSLTTDAMHNVWRKKSAK